MSLEADFVLRGAGRLVTCDAGRGEGALGVVERGALAAREGLVVWAGAERELAGAVRVLPGAVQEEAGGMAVLPGLVECHSHLVFGGDRRQEFTARMGGEAYRTGGIMATVRATRQASDAELVELSRARLDRFLAHGVTTVEAKSGYGLTPEGEARLVRLAAGLGHEVRVVVTVLAAHVVPDEQRDRPDAYVEAVCESLLPAVRGLAEFCDAWCDEGAFTPGQCRRVLARGRELGMAPKLHADQLSAAGGARLAAEVGAVSADHLEHVTEEDAGRLAEAGTTAVLIPGASMMTRSARAPARMLLERGVRVALSTDLNPGSSYSENLQLVAALGCAELGMTVEEAILGITRHAAAALGREGRAGVLRPGAACDAVVLDSRSEVDLAYHYGVNLAARVILAGRPVGAAEGAPGRA
ncbi:MAG: imidazolonepropionase [Candidatus Dormibacterales bacterium]